MLLQTNQLTKDYGRLRALDHLSLTVAPGEVFGLLGPNGSGKSTALRILLGFLRPTSGQASIGGHDCWHDGVAARSQVAYLPGELRLYENMNGRQLVSFLSRLRGRPPIDAFESLARQLEIDLDRAIANLSSGMKRKVALLQVLATHAPVLILDEPTNTLDPTMRDELLRQLRQARDKGQAVLFSSHVLTEVEQVCDRVGILQNGRLVHLQAMSELREGKLIRARFAANGQATAEPDPVPPLPGLVVRERTADRIAFEYTGPLPPVLQWLARQPLVDLQMEPLGLSRIYSRYHGGQG
jgi:ABC-2 type transport system ATP-binding protein